MFIVAPDSKDGPSFISGIEVFSEEALLTLRLCWPAVG